MYRDVLESVKIKVREPRYGQIHVFVTFVSFSWKKMEKNIVRIRHGEAGNTQENKMLYIP